MHQDSSLPLVLLDLPPRHAVFEQILSGRVSVDVAADRGGLHQSSDARALVCRGRDPIDASVLDRHEHVQAVICLGAGTDAVDSNAAAERGIEVIGDEGSGAVAVAEHVIGALIALRRHFLPASVAVGEGQWTLAREGFIGRELRGSVLSVVGFGSIAREVVAMAHHAFSMHTRVWAPRTDPGEIIDAGAEPVGQLTELFPGADALTVHVPLKDDTRGMVGEVELAALPEHAIVVNTARGAIICEDALAIALKKGRLAGAAIDVFGSEPPDPGHPLLSAPNVLLTPHTAGLTSAADERRHQAAARAVLRVLFDDSERAS